MTNGKKYNGKRTKLHDFCHVNNIYKYEHIFNIYIPYLNICLNNVLK